MQLYAHACYVLSQNQIKVFRCKFIIWFIISIYSRLDVCVLIDATGGSVVKNVRNNLQYRVLQ